MRSTVDLPDSAAPQTTSSSPFAIARSSSDTAGVAVPG